MAAQRKSRGSSVRVDPLAVSHGQVPQGGQACASLKSTDKLPPLTRDSFASGQWLTGEREGRRRWCSASSSRSGKPPGAQASQ